MYQTYGLFIDGEWRAARNGATLPVTDPADEEILGTVPMAGPAELDDALDAASRGYTTWRATPAWTRSSILRSMVAELRGRAEDAAHAMSRETGKPLAEAVGEVNAAIDQFDWYADEARRIYGHTLDGRDAVTRLQVRYDPVGPVAAFTAWNFPALLPARKIAAALAAGCSIVIKPSEEAPICTFIIAEAAIAAGLPKGVLNVVTGEPTRISAHLIASPVIRKVSLTGSVPVGKHILRLCADGVKKVSMELGGHAPVIVFEDADPVMAAQACARAKFRNAGQVCISPSRFFVHASVYEDFAGAMVEVVRGLKVGRGLDPGVDCGPIANARGRERAIRLVEDAVDKGADLLTGGSLPPTLTKGYFFSPTVLGRVPGSAAIMSEEPFAPVAPVAIFESFEEVIEKANAVPYGLAGYVFSSSLATATRAAEALEVGMVGVNDMLLASAEIPFGGVKESGMGREGGRLGILDYLEPKYVKLRLA
jgi:succinate-semialdehyde dehydrogenase / glutarate-semialdehyde dehydrogenase